MGKNEMVHLWSKTFVPEQPRGGGTWPVTQVQGGKVSNNKVMLTQSKVNNHLT